MENIPMRKWVTADEKLSNNPCLLLYALAISDGNAPADNKIYDGQDTSGELIVNLQSGVKAHVECDPPRPIMCYKGLYIDVGTNTEGLFVMWDDIPREE